MELFKFEIAKYVKNRFFMIAFVTMLLLCGTLFYVDSSTHLIQPQAYKELHQKIDGMSLAKAKSYVEEKRDTYTFYDRYQISLSREDTLVQYAQTKGEQWVSNRIEELNKLRSFDIRSYQELLHRIDNEIYTIENYEQYRVTMVEQASVNQEISIFKTKKNAAVSDKVLRAYENVDRNLPLKLAPTLGLERLISYAIPSVLCLLLMLYMIGITIYQERKRGFISFTQTMVKGKRLQYFSKLFALLVVSGLWLLCAYFLCGVITSVLYSLPDMHSFIQNVPLLMKSVLSGNVFLLLVMFLLQKVLVIVLLSSIGYALAKHIPSYPFFLFVVASLMVVSYVCYSQIPELSGWAVLKYMNLYGILQSVDYLGNYICFQGLLVPFSIYQGCIWLFIVVVMLVIVNVFFETSIIRTRSLSTKRKTNLQPHSLLFYECKKVWIKDYGLLLCSVLVVLQGILLMNTKPSITMDDIYYNDYIDTIGERTSAEATQKLDAISYQYAELERNESEDYKALELWNHYPAFLKYRENYEVLKSRGEGRLLKENEYSLLFEDSLILRATYVFMISGMIFLIVSCFYREKETGMKASQLISIKGGNVLWKDKMIALLSLCIPLCLILYSLIIWRNQQFFNQIQYSASMDNLSMFRNFGSSMTITQFLSSMMFTRLLVVLLLVPIAAFVAKKIQNRYAALFLMFTVCVLGVLLAQVTHSMLFDPLYSLLSVSLLKHIGQVVTALFVCCVLGLYCYWRGSKL